MKKYLFCQNDYHWKKDCHSHFHRDGVSLPDASASLAEREPLVLRGNWVRGQLQYHQIAGAIPDKRPLPQWRHIQQLQRASPGSTGFDLCTSSFKLLIPDSLVVCLNMIVYSPPPEEGWVEL